MLTSRPWENIGFIEVITTTHPWPRLVAKYLKCPLPSMLEGDQPGWGMGAVDTRRARAHINTYAPTRLYMRMRSGSSSADDRPQLHIHMHRQYSTSTYTPTREANGIRRRWRSYPPSGFFCADFLLYVTTRVISYERWNLPGFAATRIYGTTRTCVCVCVTLWPGVFCDSVIRPKRNISIWYGSIFSNIIRFVRREYNDRDSFWIKKRFQLITSICRYSRDDWYLLKSLFAGWFQDYRIVVRTKLCTELSLAANLLSVKRDICRELNSDDIRD